LIDIDRPEFDSDPYVQLVRNTIEKYKSFKGASAKAKEGKLQVAKEYAQKLQSLK
jgi:hypothetical protein